MSGFRVNRQLDADGWLTSEGWIGLHFYVAVLNCGVHCLPDLSQCHGVTARTPAGTMHAIWRQIRDVLAIERHAYVIARPAGASKISYISGALLPLLFIAHSQCISVAITVSCY